MYSCIYVYLFCFSFLSKCKFVALSALFVVLSARLVLFLFCTQAPLLDLSVHNYWFLILVVDSNRLSLFVSVCLLKMLHNVSVSCCVAADFSSLFRFLAFRC